MPAPALTRTSEHTHISEVNATSVAYLFAFAHVCCNDEEVEGLSRLSHNLMQGTQGAVGVAQVGNAANNLKQNLHCLLVPGETKNRAAVTGAAVLL